MTVMKNSPEARAILEAELDLALNRDVDLQTDPRAPVTLLQGCRVLQRSLQAYHEARRLERN